MNGILLVDKPKGWTSFDVVNYVRKIVARADSKKPKNTKVGHTGTLDPQATGLLVLLIGKQYTQRAPVLSKLDKRYEATMRLGETSTTGDEEGQKSFISSLEPTLPDIRKVLGKFTGEIMQTPPSYSAIKVNGQRAYMLARQGKEIKLEPRLVKIHGVDLESYKYPYVKLVCDVSSGTYVRSLVEDVGRELGSGAYMSDLRRITVGEFNIKQAVNVEGLTVQEIMQHLLP